MNSGNTTTGDAFNGLDSQCTLNRGGGLWPYLLNMWSKVGADVTNTPDKRPVVSLLVVHLEPKYTCFTFTSGKQNKTGVRMSKHENPFNKTFKY